ncbi:MOSC N-terminal beta barrel domain-containing protein [uncultured Williamsia sp.]|uniref:MOSC domain-containing protein n=1 Tax=uncultured Williamsia sp. TaxID=259311 RepID=UPI00261A4BB6|nr:MOSC N-terminal beta barrel domain-containing protein [uncultured Williamsia sp.]
MTHGRVAHLWRYPVKSLGGERLERASVTPRGLSGDRLWAVRDLEREVTASARQLPALLTASARYADAVPPDAGPGNAPEVEITFPGGDVLSSRDNRVHARLSDLTGRRVALTPLPPADDVSLHRLNRDRQADVTSPSWLREAFGLEPHEKLPDASVVRASDLMTLGRFSTPPGMFVDLAPIHVLTTNSLDTIGAAVGSDVDVRRFRPNVLVTLSDTDDDLPEARWTGGRLTLGGAVLDLTLPTIRCVVPSRAQPGFDVDRGITRALSARAERCLGSYCWVVEAGDVGVGDEITVRRPGTAARLLDDSARRARRFAFGAVAGALDRLRR